MGCGLHTCLCVPVCLCGTCIRELGNAYAFASLPARVPKCLGAERVSGRAALQLCPGASEQPGPGGATRRGDGRRRPARRPGCRWTCLRLLTGVIAHVSVDCQAGNVESLNDVAVPLLPVFNVVEDVVERLRWHIATLHPALRTDRRVVRALLRGQEGRQAGGGEEEDWEARLLLKPVEARLWSWVLSGPPRATCSSRRPPETVSPAQPLPNRPIPPTLLLWEVFLNYPARLLDSHTPSLLICALQAPECQGQRFTVDSAHRLG